MNAPILLTGATGDIGGRPLRRFEDRGRAVPCIVRQPDRLRLAAPTTQIVQGDCLDEASLDRALVGARCAYYLVHSMGRGSDFSEVDRRAAGTFARAAQRANVQRIIYLGGLTGEASSLPLHLTSRVETGEIFGGLLEQIARHARDSEGSAPPYRSGSPTAPCVMAAERNGP